MRYVFVAALFVLAIAYFYTFQFEIGSKTELQLKSASSVTFDELIHEYRQKAASSGPRVALEALQEAYDRDDVAERQCHEIAHEIGYEAYEKYGSFAEAMKFQNVVCNGGYIHGVIEQAFITSTTTNSFLQTACLHVDGATFTGWQCHHGLGHGVMLSMQHDISQSVENCETLPEVRDQKSCVNGAYMQYFTQSLAGIERDDILQICNAEKIQYQGDCYFYASTAYLLRNTDDYRGAEKWCMGAPTFNGKFTCYKGVVAEAMKRNISEPDEVRKLCRSLLISSDECIKTMISMYINHYGTLEEAHVLCDEWDSASCREGIGEHRISMFGL